MQYDIIHIIGASVYIFAMMYAFILIQKFLKKYENMEIFQVAWWLVLALIIGNKFV